MCVGVDEVRKEDRTWICILLLYPRIGAIVGLKKIKDPESIPEKALVVLLERTGAG